LKRYVTFPAPFAEDYFTAGDFLIFLTNAPENCLADGERSLLFLNNKKVDGSIFGNSTSGKIKTRLW
jgi:hypothetical protein